LSAYLDASVLLPTLVEEPGSAAVDAFLLAASQELFISDFAAAEVASALSRLVRMGLLDADDASARLADFDVWRAAASSPASISTLRMPGSRIFTPSGLTWRCAPLTLCVSPSRDASTCRW
jgi:hypothetical protein